MKKLSIILLALTLALTLLACDGKGDDSSSDLADGSYAITVLDKDGNPLAGASVIYCEVDNSVTENDGELSCRPWGEKTDANGKVTITLDTAKVWSVHVQMYYSDINATYESEHVHTDRVDGNQITLNVNKEVAM